MSAFSIEKTYLYLPEHVFPYIQAQSSVFTVHHKEEDKFVALEQVKDSGLTKIVISPKVVPGMRLALDRLGINSSFLFPGLPGLVGRIRFHHEMPPDEAALFDFAHWHTAW
jgi:hypothetical protein